MKNKNKKMLFSDDIPRTMTIMRGLPGSGKSTVARNCKNVVSADNYFVKNGVYEFVPKELKNAHRKCVESVFEAIENGDNICVDNANIIIAHVLGYVDMAVKRGYKIRIVEVSGDYGSIHNVPDDVLDRMKKSWEAWDKEKSTIEVELIKIHKGELV